MELMFLLGIHHVARIRRIRCRMEPPPPWVSFPRIKYHMVKVPHLWDFSPPPPLPKQAAHAVPIIHIWNLCWRRFAIEGGVLPWDLFRGEGLPYGFISLGKFCYGISSGGRFAIRGETLPYGIVPPWGSSAIGFLPGEGLPYGIPSGGTFAIWYNFRGGGGRGGGGGRIPM